jgi:hypothetical protein
MEKQIYMVGGSKGGVGKTLMSLALIDFIGEQNINLIETDTSNPDVYKVMSERVHKAYSISLDEKNGWLDLIDVIDDSPDHPVVINTRAANNVGMSTFGDLLIEASNLIKRPITVFWVLNTDRDGVALLKSFLQQFGHNKNIVVHVVLNLKFGDVDSFIYQGSETAKLVEARGGKTITIPELADRVRVKVYNERQSLSVVATQGSLGNRIEAEHWRKLVHESLQSVNDLTAE